MTNGDTKHYNSRKSRVEATASGHSASRLSAHKALPSAPDARRISRPAEKRRPREDQRTSGSTLTSGSRPESRNSPVVSSGLIPAGMTNQEDFYARRFSPTSSRAVTPSSLNTLQQQTVQESLPSPRKTLTKRTKPIELPADVPHSALLQAPLSKENRRSMNLEPKAPVPADQSVSRRLSNNLLASILKSPLSNRLSRTPQSVTSGKTNESYTTAVDSPSGHTAEYFSATDVRRTTLVEEGAETPGANMGNSYGDEKGLRGLGIDSQLHGTIPAPQRSTGISLAKSTKPYHPAFTSHPPDNRIGASPLASHPPAIATVTGPHFKEETFSTQSASSTVKKVPDVVHSRFPSLTASTLGEPGPEIDDSDPFDLTTIVQGSELARTAATSSAGPLISIEPPVPDSHPVPEPGPEAMRSNIRDVVDVGVSHVLPTPARETPRPLVAELEGAALTPGVARPVVSQEKSFGPVELEAPVQHTFILPPRSSGITSSRPDEGATTMTSATIATQSDFFKMPPPAIAQEEESSPKKSAVALGKQPLVSTPLYAHQAPLKIVKEDRASLPPVILARSIPRKPAKPNASRTARLQSSDILEKLSSTPPGSPIHSRAASELSANSAQRLSVRNSIGSTSSHPLAPSEQAPPPPGPGGRTMVSPDYAATGMFEGEKKAKTKRGSRGSAGNQASWKKFFGGHHSPLSGTPDTPGTATTEYFMAEAGKSEVEGAPEQSHGMLDSAGKDVLWFKGMSRDGVWVSTSAN